MSIYADAFRQCFFIPKPTFTEKELPDQSGRVSIVTGGYAGCGKELSKILYGKNGTVYVAGRSKDKADNAIAEIKRAHPSSDGRLEFLYIDLSDLTTVKPAAEDFMRREQRLDVLTNNAGVMATPVGTKGAQGHEIQMCTNVLGPWLFTQLLDPVIQKTAASSPAGSVRVTWAASLGTLMSPTGGVAINENSGAPQIHGHPQTDYAQTKSANVFLAREYQAQHQSENIISNAWNPGNLASELGRHFSWFQMLSIKWLTYPPILGGYTELFAGWAEEAGKEDKKGAYIGPWGRFVLLRKDVDEGKNSKKFVEWCEKETKPFR